MMVKGLPDTISRRSVGRRSLLISGRSSSPRVHPHSSSLAAGERT